MKKIIALLLVLGVTLSALAQEKSGKIKIACIGDSITEGFGLKNSCTDSYPIILGYMLGDNYEVRNFGITGKCVQKDSNDPYWKSGRIPRIKEFDPDIFIVKLGTNDSKLVNWKSCDAFQTDYEAYLDEVANPNKKQTFILATGAWVKKDAIGITRKVMTEGVNPTVLKIAKKRGLKVIDFHSLLENRPDWYCDDIHPNEHGAYKMAELAYRFLTGKKTTPQIPYFRAKKSDYEGFTRYDFKLRWSDTTIWLPQKKSANGEWLWVSTKYKDTDNERELILGLLKKGWHIVYTNQEGWWGNPNAVRWYENVYRYIPELLKVAEKPSIAGFNTGAFHTVNFASKHPDKIEKVYLCKPTLDILKWAKDGHMRTFLQEWKLTETDLENFSDSPIENIKKFAENNTKVVILPSDEEQEKYLKTIFPKKSKDALFIKDSGNTQKETAIAIKFLTSKEKTKKTK